MYIEMSGSTLTELTKLTMALRDKTGTCLNLDSDTLIPDFFHEVAVSRSPFIQRHALALWQRMYDDNTGWRKRRELKKYKAYMLDLIELNDSESIVAA